VGASGAVYGILVAFAWLFPNFKIIFMFLPIPVAAKYFVPVLLLVDLTAGVTGISIFGQNNIAHFAHIGGATAGFLMVQFWLRQNR
jgi:membrane associated rhomboid family serine protease